MVIDIWRLLTCNSRGAVHTIKINARNCMFGYEQSNKGFICFWLKSICPRGYKTVSMLNSAEHESLNAHKHKISSNSTFSGSEKSRMLFFLLINVKMPTIELLAFKHL